MKKWIAVAAAAAGVLVVLVTQIRKAPQPLAPAPAPAPSAGPVEPAAPEPAPPSGWAVSDEELARMRAEAPEEARAVEEAAARVAEVVKERRARFAPGETPTPEKVRAAVADIMSEPDKLWGGASLEKAAADCRSGAAEAELAVSTQVVAVQDRAWRDERVARLCAGQLGEECSDGKQDFDCHEFQLAASAGRGEVNLKACSVLIAMQDEKAGKPPVPQGAALEDACRKLRDLYGRGDESFCRQFGKYMEDEACGLYSRVSKGPAACRGLEHEEADYCRSAALTFKAAKSGKAVDCAGDVVCLATLKAPAVCSASALAARKSANSAADCKDQAPMLRQSRIKRYREEADAARKALEDLKTELRQAIPTANDAAAQGRLEGLIGIVDKGLFRIQARGQGDKPGGGDQGG